MLLVLLSVIDVVLAVNVARNNPELNLNETYFATLQNYHVNATAATETKYPWIAKVIHSRVNNAPYVGTASCLRKRIFITAVRCIYSLKVLYTTVLYQKSHRLPVLAFVLPSKGTKQNYDDIGFIIVEDVSINNWHVVPLFGVKNRTDNAYEWFKSMPKAEYSAVGYATTKGLHKILPLQVHYNLTELKVVIGIDICAKIFDVRNKLKNGLNIPCYHSCTVDQHKNEHESCKKYHGVEGSAIIDDKTKKLIGVTTWGHVGIKSRESPVGFSVANSDNFYKDYKCAIAISNAKVSSSNQSLQKLCN